MKTNRKVLLSTIVLLILAILVSGCSSTKSAAAKSDDYPKQPVKILVGYSAGGSSDKAARLLQPYLEKELGSSVVVENMPGAGGQVAATKLMTQNPDGYTILAVNQPGIFYTIAMDNAKYKQEDLLPIWVESHDPIVLIAMKASPWNNLKDFIEAAKAEPGKYAVGVASGGGQQSVALWLQKKLNLDFNIVTYDGGGPASAALLGGNVDAIFGDAFARMDLRGEAKCLGIASGEANSVWPEGKPFNEQLTEYGVKTAQDEFQARYGAYWARKEFKEQYPQRYEKLVNAFKNVAKNEEYLAKLKEAGLMDSMVLEEGDKYTDDFSQAYKTVESEIAPLFEKKK